jgi:hypothetical protein
MPSIILLILVILSIILLIITIPYNKKILCGIVTIDRDAQYADALYKALLQNNINDIMVVTRITDSKSIEFWKDKLPNDRLVCIDHYEIDDENKRHNMRKIAYKRNIIVKYAIDNNYTHIWFVDSDVIPTTGVLDELLRINSDIAIAAYKPKWYPQVCVGIKDHNDEYKLHIIDKNCHGVKDCKIAGFGCTLIKRKAYKNFKIEVKNIKHIYGDDIGFFINADHWYVKCKVLNDLKWVQQHL